MWATTRDVVVVTELDHTMSPLVLTTHSPHTVESPQEEATLFQGNIQCVSLFFLQDSNQSHHNPFNHHQGVIAGSNNQANNQCSAIIAGKDNKAEGWYSATIAGNNNKAEGWWSALIAGDQNETRGENSAIVGGYKKMNTATFSAIV